jgi:hypothetical protein
MKKVVIFDETYVFQIIHASDIWNPTLSCMKLLLDYMKHFDIVKMGRTELTNYFQI